MSRLSDRIRLLSSLGGITYFFLALSTVVYYSLFGQGNDYPIFHRAGFAMQTLGDPWLTSSDPTYSIYLNGPNTSLLFLFLSYLPMNHGLLLVRILTVGSIPFVAHIVLRRFGLESYIWSTSILLLFSFSVRSNLEYGSLYVIYLCLAISTVSFGKSHPNISAHILVGIFVGFCLDYKPQSFLILLFLVNSLYRLIGMLITIVSGSIISFLFTSELPYFRWFEAISTRGQSSFKSPDQMSILGMAWEVGLPHWIPGSLMTLLFVVTSSKIFAFWKPGCRIYCFAAFFFALTWLNFFLHPTDLLLVELFVIIFLLHGGREMPKVQYFVLGACLVWSNNYLVQLGVLLAISLGIRKFPYLRKNAIWLFFPNVIFSISIHFFPHEQNVIRHLINYLPVAFCLIYVDRWLKLFEGALKIEAPKNR